MAIALAVSTDGKLRLVSYALGSDYPRWFELNEIVTDGKSSSKKSKDGDTESSFNKLKDGYLKRKGIDAHKIKEDFMGKKAPIAHWDLYKDKKTGEIVIFKKGGKGSGTRTGKYID